MKLAMQLKQQAQPGLPPNIPWHKSYLYLAPCKVARRLRALPLISPSLLRWRPSIPGLLMLLSRRRGPQLGRLSLRGRDSNRQRAATLNPCQLPGLRIRFPRGPLSGLPGKDTPARRSGSHREARSWSIAIRSKPPSVRTSPTKIS